MREKFAMRRESAEARQPRQTVSTAPAARLDAPRTSQTQDRAPAANAPPSLAGIPVFDPRSTAGITGFLADEESGAAPDNGLVGQEDGGSAVPDAGTVPDTGAAATPAGAGPVDAGPAAAQADAGPAASPADAGPSAADAGPAAATSDAGAAAPPGTSSATPQAATPATPAAGPVIQSKATVHAPDGTADDRKTIGVVETIEFTLDGGQVADWSANNGWPGAKKGVAKYEWAAPEAPGTSTITATLPATGETATLDMTVIAPSDINMRSHDEIAFPAGSPGAGMHLTVIALPRKVNFGWISFLEVPGPASGVTGFFAAKAAAGTDLAHHPNPDFVRFNFANTFQFDTASASGDPVSPPPPWADGRLTWSIPNRYRAFNSTGTGRFFTTTTQRFAIDAAGAITITKQGERVSRHP
jgi:hypothetical protein